MSSQDDRKIRDLLEGIESESEPDVDYMKGCLWGVIVGILLCACSAVFEFISPPPPEFYASGGETWSVIGDAFTVVVSGLLGAVLTPLTTWIIRRMSKSNRLR
jgi:hypothetical protein